jgi:membrane-associated phospholipid phosphatase
MNIPDKIFYRLGQSGFHFLNALSVYLLWGKRKLLIGYIFGLFFNTIINLCLKYIIKQPRPNKDSKQYDIAIQNCNRRDLIDYCIISEMYGMPSGHSSSVAFSTAYIFFALHSNKISSFYLFIAIVTAIQRVIYNFHSLDQVFIGFIVGTVIAAAAYYLTRIVIIQEL